MLQYCLFTILLLFIVLLTVFRSKRAERRGIRGERLVSSILSSLPTEYTLFNDVYIEVKGHSVQIDHVVISQYGIFVIETKNYTGWIFGTDQSEYWIKNVYGNKYQFRNPLKQNYSHLKSLQALLDISEAKFVPIVVFLNGATLKCNTMGYVIYPQQLKHTILDYHAPLLTHAEIENIKSVLSAACIIDKNRKNIHTHRIKEEVSKKQTLIASGICPICKGRLVHRTGKYGSFWGCSNYPQCKFRYK